MILQNVVVVTDSLSIDGGTARVAIESAMALAKRGVRVTVFAASGEPSSELLGCENLRIVSMNQTDILGSRNVLISGLRGIWNWRVHNAMSELLKGLDPSHTVVHLHCWTKALSSSVLASIVAARFPVALTIHEYFSVCPTGCFYLHRDQKVCTLRPMSLACVTKDCDSRSYIVKLYRVIRQLVTRLFGRIPNGIENYFTVSRFSENVIKPFLPAKRRIFYIGNPVDVARQAPLKVAAHDLFVFIGRLSPEKGCVLLAQAAREAGVKVLFIGDGPEREMIRKYNPEAQITGWLDPSAVAARLKTARCLVVPSLWYETFGLVVLEAAALGIPAIVPDRTAPRDLIEVGATGLAFERGNVADLAARLRQLLNDDFLEKMGIAAYEAFWNNPPTMRLHVDRLLDAYRNVLLATGVHATAYTL